MALSQKAAERLAEKNLLAPELVKRALAPEMEGTAGEDDILRVPFRIGVTLNRSMGHASRFFRALRDRGVFYGARCPQCGHTLFPPIRPVCLRCIKQGMLVEYEPLELGELVEGTIVAFSKLVRGTSKQVGQGELYPCLVRADGADNAHWQLVLPEDGVQIRVGARVRSVLKEQTERTGEMSDFAFVLLRPAG